jgi:hypothetical protein
VYYCCQFQQNCKYEYDEFNRYIDPCVDFNKKNGEEKVMDEQESHSHDNFEHSHDYYGDYYGGDYLKYYDEYYGGDYLKYYDEYYSKYFETPYGENTD